MHGLPFVPPTAPFSERQRAWLNGYLVGLLSSSEGAPAPAPAKPAEPLLLLYGSQTGTAEALAKKFAKAAATQGFLPQILELNACSPAILAASSKALIVTSTWGDGDPPDNAATFWTFLQSAEAPPLPHLSYSILALGDSNYSNFCGAGKKFDERLSELNAKRVVPRKDCDLDYDSPAQEWFAAVLKAFAGGPATPPPTTTPTAAPLAKKKEYPKARLIQNRRLNKPASSKDTRHFAFSLEGTGLRYEAGDALGVLPSNCPSLVQEIVSALGCDGEEAVIAPDGEETSLRFALLYRCEIHKIPKSLIELAAPTASSLATLLIPENKEACDQYCHGRDILDLIQEHSIRLEPRPFIAALRKLPPRLYSISSSPLVTPAEVHLTVGVVRYQGRLRAKKGVCSTFLAERVEPEGEVQVYVQTSPHFRLPRDHDLPVIMIGPGTGIAPFRAFLQERHATGAKGKNWLFFGDQQRANDFLYEEEISHFQKEGVLTRLDLAFSRDQKEKIYVQNRMLEQAEEFFAWLEQGAFLYVCGDAKRMARDVDATLHQIIEKVGSRSPEAAAAYVNQLKSDKRYLRDVY